MSRLERIEPSDGHQTVKQLQLQIPTNKTSASNAVQALKIRHERPESKRPTAKTSTNDNKTLSVVSSSDTATTHLGTQSVRGRHQWVTGDDAKAGKSTKLTNYRLHLINLLPDTNSMSAKPNAKKHDDSKSSLNSRHDVAYDWSFAMASLMFIFIVTLPILVYYFFASRRWNR